MAELNDWDIAAANNNDTPPDGWPENTMQYSEVNNTGREGMSVLARYYQDTNGTLSTAGAADAYTLTTNGAYTSYFAGLRLVATFHATNTTASVIDVNLIGATNIVDRAGNPLVGNELTAGGIYELLHDGTQFQLMGTPGGAVSSESGVFTNSDAPDLVDTDVALVVGALDPDTSTHVEMGPQQIQAKTNATTPAILNLNALGGDVRAGAQSGTGGVVLFDDGLERAATAGGGNFTVFADDSLDPSTVTLSLSGQGGSPARSLHGYLGTTDLQTTNLLQGGRQIIKATKTGGGTVDTIIADPDDDTALFDEGVEVARTLPAANGGFEANNTLTGAGFERVLTVSDVPSDQSVVLDSADELRTSTTTLSDSSLVVSLVAGVFYEFEAWIKWREVSGIGQGIRYDFFAGGAVANSFISSITENHADDSFRVDVEMVPSTAYNNAVSFIPLSGTANVNASIWIRGSVKCTTSGTFTFRFAQQVSSANSTALRTGSWFRCTPVKSVV